MRPSLETLRKMRALWKPRHEEMPEPCPGCPFMDGNDDAFAKVVRVLRNAMRIVTGKVDAKLLRHARRTAREDIRGRGEFTCHHTAYDITTGKAKAASEARQCAGAARLYRAGEV